MPNGLTVDGRLIEKHKSKEECRMGGRRALSLLVNDELRWRATVSQSAFGPPEGIASSRGVRSRRRRKGNQMDVRWLIGLLLASDKFKRRRKRERERRRDGWLTYEKLRKKEDIQLMQD